MDRLAPYSSVTKYHLFTEAYYGQTLILPLPHGGTSDCGDPCKPSSAVQSSMDQIFVHLLLWPLLLAGLCFRFSVV